MTDATNAENPFAGQGAVLLDIGGEIGALVVTMPDGLEGLEVEIQPAGTGPKPLVHDQDGAAGSHDHEHHDHEHHDHGHDYAHDHDHDHDHDHGAEHHPHVAVVNRPVGDGSVPSLVFPDVVEGDYELVPKLGGPVQLAVRVNGGEVTTVAWGGHPTD